MTNKECILGKAIAVVKVGVNAIGEHFKLWCMLRDTDESGGPFGIMLQWPWKPTQLTRKWASMEPVTQSKHGI